VPSSSSVESGHVILIVHGLDRNVLLADLVDHGWWLRLAFSLGGGGNHVHLINHHGFWVLLRSEFRCQSGLEQVHLEEVEHHGSLLPLEGPESLVGNSVIDIVVWIWGEGSVLQETFFDDSDRPGDSGN